MSGHTKYRIETVEDFDTVPDEKLDACLADFAEFCAMRRLLVAVLDADKVRPLPVFTWVDDGVAGVSALRFEADGSEVMTIDADGLHVPPTKAEGTDGGLTDG